MSELKGVEIGSEREENDGIDGSEKESSGYFGRLSLFFFALGIFGIYHISTSTIEKLDSVYIGLGLLFSIAFILFLKYDNIKSSQRTKSFALETIELDEIKVQEDLESKNGLDSLSYQDEKMMFI